VFELGLKKYGDDPEFALCYINFLSHLNGGLGCFSKKYYWSITTVFNFGYILIFIVDL